MDMAGPDDDLRDVRSACERDLFIGLQVTEAFFVPSMHSETSYTLRRWLCKADREGECSLFRLRFQFLEPVVDDDELVRSRTADGTYK